MPWQGQNVSTNLQERNSIHEECQDVGEEPVTETENSKAFSKDAKLQWSRTLNALANQNVSTNHQDRNSINEERQNFGDCQVQKLKTLTFSASILR